MSNIIADGSGQMAPTKCFFYNPYMDTLKKMIKGYYTLPGCVAGGPLHVLLDDDNYDIGSIHFCMNHCFENLNGDVQYDPYSTEACVLGIVICNEYAKMSLGERAAFDAYLCGDTLECKGDCENCDVRGELFEYMKEAEENAKT